MQDFDKLQVSNESYLESLGGRVIFNEDGTYAWENAKGTKVALTLTANYGQSTSYQIIGSQQINSKLCLFLTDGINSEIALVYQEQFNVFTYQTIYNDLYDPYGNKLNFSLKYQMRDMQVCVENNTTERVYFNDDHNEPRVFNVLLGLQSVSPQFTSGSYLPIGGAVVGSVYPSFYSVHGMSQMVDLTWGKFKFQQTISGSLLSGEYQYAYRYIHQTGYVSPWSPLSAHVLLTTDPISGNWTEYQMQQSGAASAKGLQFELKYLDTRYQQVEVAALYWRTDTVADSAYTFFKGNIPNTGSVIVQHQAIGATIAIDSLVQRYTEVMVAKTGNMKDNSYHLANIEVYPIGEINTALITAEPITRPMLSDETTDEVAVNRVPPFTNQTPKTTSITDNMADGLPETYSVVNDYINYKGTQWTNLFKGNWGGEIYPYAIVLFDRKGQPWFAQHITDFTFPQRYSNTWQDARLSGITNGTTGSIGDFRHTNTLFPAAQQITDDIYTDKWFLNLMGIKFSGIDLTDVLYDASGNLQISGFSIVRTDRIKQILAQGLVMSTGDTVNESNEEQIVPLPTMFNGYLNYDGTPFGTYSSTDRDYVGLNPEIYASGALPSLNPSFPNTVYADRWNIASFESPDYMIDNSLLANDLSNDQMQMIDVCVKSYGGNSKAGQAPWNLGNESYYQKNYRTTLNNILSAQNATGGTYDSVSIGDKINIDEWFPNIKSGQAIFNILFYNTTPPVGNYLFWGNFRYLSRAVIPTCVFTFGFNDTTQQGIRHLGVLADDEGGNVANGHGAYFIANYRRDVGSYAITESLLQNRVYHNIGHFVPINQSIINTVTAIPANNGRCIFNNVPVWGGDCYLDYWTYQRLYADLDQVNGDNQDYQIGLSFPCECNFNIALRQGNTLERYGSTPAATFNSGGTLFPDGLYYLTDTDNKLETFAVNSVLQAEDLIDLYNSKPDDFNQIYDFPVRQIYTGTKIYGEKFDTYRLFPVGNFKDADGSKGEINSLQHLFNYLYIIQRNGFARARFNDRETLVGSTGSSLNIASQLGLQGFDYINTVFGTQHQFSVVNSGRMIYWVDSEKGKMLRFGADGMLPISDEYGHHNFFTNKTREYWKVKDPQNLLYPAGEKPYYDSPLYAGGIVGVVDFKNESIYHTFTDKNESVLVNDEPAIIVVGVNKTLEYSELNNQYKGFHPFFPKIYANFKEGFFSPDPSSPSIFYVHDEGLLGHIYGTYVNSKLKFVVNPATVVAKWFDNGSMAINDRVASSKIFSVTGTSENMPPQTIFFQTDNRWRYLQGFAEYPIRAINANTRLRGKTCIIEIEVLNDAANQLVRLSSHRTMYRVSPKV